MWNTYKSQRWNWWCSHEKSWKKSILLGDQWPHRAYIGIYWHCLHPGVMYWEDKHHFCGTPVKNVWPMSGYGKRLYGTRLRDISQNKRAIKVMTDRETLRNSSRLKEIKETWQQCNAGSWVESWTRNEKHTCMCVRTCSHACVCVVSEIWMGFVNLFGSVLLMLIFWLVWLFCGYIKEFFVLVQFKLNIWEWWAIMFVTCSQIIP